MLALIVKFNRTIKCLMWVYIVSLYKGIIKVINGMEGGKMNVKTFRSKSKAQTARWHRRKRQKTCNGRTNDH